MATMVATNLATNDRGLLTFAVDFDKKKLTKTVLDCQTHHQRLQQWLSNPVMSAHFADLDATPAAIYSLTWGEIQDTHGPRLQAITSALTNRPYFQDTALMEIMSRGLRKNKSPARLLLRAGLTPVPTDEIMPSLESFMVWRKNLSSQSLSPLYQTLISVYYLTLIQPMGAIQTAFNFVFLYQELKKLEFGCVADRIIAFYAQHEDIVADTLAMCFHARDKKYHQHPWFQLFFEAWAWALDQIDHDIQVHCFQACFQARARMLLDDKTFNERQFHLLMQLEHEKTIRDKKSLGLCLWYRMLYKGLTKRTQERDFNVLCEQGLVQMCGKYEFKVGGF